MTRVLLLEDSDALAASTVGVIEATGHSVVRFRTVAEASRAIPPIGFDVLLCDFDLPDGTGLDFLSAVNNSSFLGLAKWTTIIYSGLDRSAAVAESGVPVDHVLLKGADTARAIIAILDEGAA